MPGLLLPKLPQLNSLIQRFNFRKTAPKPAGMVAIEVGQDGIALVRLVPGEPQVKCPLVQFTHGVSQQDFTNSLSAAVEQYGLKDSDCCWLLHPNDYRILLIDRPKVPASEYTAASQWLIKDMIDFPVESAVIDTFLPSAKVSSMQDKLYVVVAQKEYLKSFQAVIAQSGLQLVKITVQEMALRNLLANSETQPAALLQWGDTRSLLITTEGQEITMMRTINVGLRQMLSGQYDASRMIEEVQRSLKYYVQQLRQTQPEVTYFSPLPTSQADITTQLGSALLQPFDVGAYCESDSPIDADQSSKVFACFGAAWPEGESNG